MYIYTRTSIVDPDDFSVGLVFEDLAGNRYPFVRCNGPSPQPHINRWPRRRSISVTPHVHHLTEYYQRRAAERPGQVGPDGFAVPTRLYRDPVGPWSSSPVR
jgi:hypothetical protein